MTPCPSELALDRLLAGELAIAEAATLRDHIGGCAPCQALVAEIEAGQAAFAALPVPMALARAQAAAKAKAGATAASATRRRRVGPALAMAAAVAAAAAVLLLVRSSDTREPGGTRLKGGARLGFLVKRGAAIVTGAAGERVAPGDALNFTITTTAPRHVAVLSLDGGGHASVYFPTGGAQAVAAEAGTNVVLPQSTILDDVLGEEALYGLFCTEAVALEPLRAGLEAHPEAPRWPASCEVDRLHIEKAAPR